LNDTFFFSAPQLKRIPLGARALMTLPSWIPVSAQRIDETLDATFGSQLRADGFQLAKARMWVRARTPDIADLFQIQAIKGATLTPRWGWSLTFVPHVKNGHLRWHRTLKSAQFDVIDDPLDLALPEAVPSLLLHTARGEEGLHAQARTLCPFAVAQADRFWQRVEAIEDLRNVLFELKARTNVRFDSYGYVAHPIALAFTLARLGEQVAAGEELSRFVHFRDGAPDLRAALLTALEAASPRRGA